MTDRQFQCEQNVAMLLKHSLPEDYLVYHCVVNAHTHSCDYCDGIESQSSPFEHQKTGTIIIYNEHNKSTHVEVISTLKNSAGKVLCLKKRNCDPLSTFELYFESTDVDWYVSVDGNDNVKCFKKEDIAAGLSEDVIRPGIDDDFLHMPLFVAGKFYSFEEMINQF